MKMNKFTIYLSLILTVVFALGCQPKRKDKRERVGRGRANVTGNFSAFDSRGSRGIGDNKQWGQVLSTQGQNAFQQAVFEFTKPSLRDLSEADQLGYVSGDEGQRTGIRFYGNAITKGGSGGSYRNFDPSSMYIHVEVYDDRTSEGQRSPIVVEINPNISGFVEAGGQVQDDEVELYFADEYGAIMMYGQIDGDYFNGVMEFMNGHNGQRMELGEFTVPTCGFFQCN